jgi:hypothetical protein
MNVQIGWAIECLIDGKPVDVSKLPENEYQEFKRNVVKKVIEDLDGKRK